MGANASCSLVDNVHDLKEILRVEDSVIALFYASWCPFSQRFLPIFQKHVGKEGRHFVMVQNDQESMADQYSLKVYPTVLFFEKGIVLKRLDGVLGFGLEEKQFIEWMS
ncbi:MAG: thioredoxin [Deltaproteobacteria bacterium]|nr:thioredoxin [Deltaproteobacteria bacterium]